MTARTAPPPVADLTAAITEAERLLHYRAQRVGLRPETAAIVASVWCGPGERDVVQFTEAALRALVTAARERLAGSGAP